MRILFCTSSRVGLSVMRRMYLGFPVSGVFSIHLTKQINSVFHSRIWNEIRLWSDSPITYIENEIGMNMVTVSLLNEWRKQHGLHSWKLWSSYLKQNGEPVLTLYPFSSALVPREPKWGEHIHITGYWSASEKTIVTRTKNSQIFLLPEKSRYILGLAVSYSKIWRMFKKGVSSCKGNRSTCCLPGGWNGRQKKTLISAMWILFRMNGCSLRSEA